MVLVIVGILAFLALVVVVGVGATLTSAPDDTDGGATLRETARRYANGTYGP